jgi:hypothetical protein
MVQSTRFPHQAHNGQVDTVTRRVINWEYDVHLLSNERCDIHGRRVASG